VLFFPPQHFHQKVSSNIFKCHTRNIWQLTWLLTLPIFHEIIQLDILKIWVVCNTRSNEGKSEIFCCYQSIASIRFGVVVFYHSFDMLSNCTGSEAVKMYIVWWYKPSAAEAATELPKEGWQHPFHEDSCFLLTYCEWQATCCHLRQFGGLEQWWANVGSFKNLGRTPFRKMPAAGLKIAQNCLKKHVFCQNFPEAPSLVRVFRILRGSNPPDPPHAHVWWWGLSR